MTDSSSSIVVTTPLLKTSCTLGEGPLFDPETSLLHFVDISENKVHHFNTLTSELSTDQFAEPVSALALRSNHSGLACVAKSGFALIEYDAEAKPTLRYLAQPLPEDKAPHTRFNDGACDKKGRFFAGTVHSKNPAFGGSLYCFDPADSSCRLIDDDAITDSNGIGWSADDKTLYFTNSLVNLIYAYDYDLETGQASNRRIFSDGIALGFAADTYPDGFCLDSEGCIWSARWAGSKIVRFAKDGRSVDFEIVFPACYSVTACCFGGPENDQLFVTTAHPGAMGGDSTLIDKFPDSGHLFVVDLSGRFKGAEWRYKFHA